MWHKAYIQQLGLADSQARAPLLLLPAPAHLAPTVAGAAIRPRDRCLVGAHLPVAARAEQAATRLRRPPSLPTPRALRAPTPPRVAAAGLHSPTHPSTQTTGSTACAPPSRRARPAPTRPPARCPPARPLCPRAPETPGRPLSHQARRRRRSSRMWPPSPRTSPRPTSKRTCAPSRIRACVWPFRFRSHCGAMLVDRTEGARNASAMRPSARSLSRAASRTLSRALALPRAAPREPPRRAECSTARRKFAYFLNLEN